MTEQGIDRVLGELARCGNQFVGDVKNISSDDEYYAASKQSTFQIPDGAREVRFRVRPISKEVSTDKNILEKFKDAVESVVGVEKKKYHYVAEWTSWVKYTVGDPLDAVGIPTVKLEDVFTKNGVLYQKLTATLTNIANVGTNITHVQFQIAKDNGSILETTGNLAINTNTNYVSYSRDVAVGHEYTVRARGVMKGLYSEWSQYSTPVKTAPLTASGFTVCRAHSKTAVYLEWAAVETATSYEIQYTNDLVEFDNVQSLPTTNVADKATQCIINNLDTGKEYYFRIRAVNDGNPASTSPWSSPSLVTIGTVPAAPTTWSSSTTITTDEALILYWVHNSKDGSSQEWAEVDIRINGETMLVPPIRNSTEEDEKDKTSSLIVTTSKTVYDEYEAQGRNVYLIMDDISDGATLEWRVHTKGVIDEYGEWSIMRTVNMHARPRLELSLFDVNDNVLGTNDNGNYVVAAFPMHVKAVPGPETQKPIGYHLTVTAHSIYDIADDVGNIETIGADGLIYSEYFDVGTDLQVELSAHNIALKNNVHYTVTCVVSMDSGLTATASADFTVAWDEVEYIPDAELSIDQESFMAYVRPYCVTRTRVYKAVDKENGEFVVTDEILNYAYGEPLPSIASSEYCWTKTELEYSNGSTTVLYGVGEAGVASIMGKQPLLTRVTYCKSGRNNMLPFNTWLDDKPQSVGTREYLWTKTVDTYDTGTYTTYAVNPIGIVDTDSLDVVAFGKAYQKSNSDKAIPTGTWVDRLPTARTTTGELVQHGVGENDN
jgi:hypothetical protein